jgi:hypothetical protein
MRQFARPFPMASLSLEARILYTAFLAFLLCAVFTSVWLLHDDGISTSTDVVAYYRGTDALPSAPTSGGPALTLPDDVASIAVEKSARQVMETFHFHAFTMPLLLLVLGHIFFLCPLSLRHKVLVLVVGSASTFVHLLAPVAVRFASAGWAWLFMPSAVLLMASWLWMIVLPLWFMWKKPQGQVIPLPRSMDAPST